MKKRKEDVFFIMKIVYANVSLEEIKNTRRSALIDVPGTMLEVTKSGARSFPLILIISLLAYRILELFSLKFPVFMEKVQECESYDDKPLALLTLAVFGYLAMGGFAIYVTAVAVGRIYRYFVYKCIPIKTPCEEQNKRNRVFYDQTASVETGVEQQNKLKNVLKDDEAVFVLNNDELEIQVQKEGYSLKHVVKLSEAQKERVEENGVLDFTYLDDDWRKALSEKAGIN